LILVTAQTSREPVRVQITEGPGYLRADLYNRRTPEETRTFLNEVAAECIKRGLFRLLIFVHSSKPMFTVEKYGFSSYADLAAKHSGRIALVTDSVECCIAQDYVALLARLRGANVRTFRESAAAIRWLIDRTESRDTAKGPATQPLP
jgi:hypothetical protein